MDSAVLFFSLWPSWLIYGSAVLFGLLFGSFANVVICRLPQDKSIAFPGSHCPQCLVPISWYDNLPLLSFILLRGRCRHCKKKIPVKYPVVELIVAILLFASLFKFGPSLSLFVKDWPWLFTLVVITFIDLEHRIIPDPLSLGGLAWGLICAALFPETLPGGFLPSLLGAGVGFGIFFGTAVLFERITGKEGLGGGDIKLLAMLGAFLGLQGVLVTIIFSSIIGSVIGIAWGVLSKEKQILKTAIPYGPFLALGALFYYFLGDLWFQFMNLT